MSVVSGVEAHAAVSFAVSTTPKDGAEVASGTVRLRKVIPDAHQHYHTAKAAAPAFR